MQSHRSCFTIHADSCNSHCSHDAELFPSPHIPWVSLFTGRSFLPSTIPNPWQPLICCQFLQVCHFKNVIGIHFFTLTCWNWVFFFTREDLWRFVLIVVCFSGFCLFYFWMVVCVIDVVRFVLVWFLSIYLWRAFSLFPVLGAIASIDAMYNFVQIFVWT